MWLSWWSICLAGTKSRVPSPAPLKPGMGAHDCYHSILEVEAEASEVQGHPWLHSKFKVSLGYMRPPSQRKRGKRKRGDNIPTNGLPQFISPQICY